MATELSNIDWNLYHASGYLSVHLVFLRVYYTLHPLTSPVDTGRAGLKHGIIVVSDLYIENDFSYFYFYGYFS